MPIKVDFNFDPVTYRHYMNGHASVLHCHHYMALTTKLAEDTAEFGGPKILREVTEDSIRPLFDDYFVKESVMSPEERLQIGEEYYAIMGMGRIVVSGAEDGGEAIVLHSHVDEGWIKKWGKHSKGINHFTAGYLIALFAAVFGKPARSYVATEKASIVTGEADGKFLIEPA